MSEFSDSLHLLNTSIAIALRAVESSGATALVLPQQGKHLTLVTTEGKKIAAAAPGPAVWWDFSADHALEVELLDRGQQQGRIVINFEQGEHVLEGDAAWLKLAGLALEPLRGLLRPNVPPDAKTWSKQLSEALGLRDAAFVAGRDLKRPQRVDELKQRYPDAILLNEGSRMRWLTDAEQARRGDVDAERAARAAEKVYGPPLLAPPPSRKEAAWTLKTKGTIELVLENLGGEGKGICLELECDLFAKGAAELVSVEVDGQPVSGTLTGAKWSASQADLTWPAACDPSKPRSTLKRKVVLSLKGKSPGSALLMVRINPAAAPAAKGRFTIGRTLSVG